MLRKPIVPPQYRSEEPLVRAAQQGDQRAQEHLILEHPPIRSVISTLKRRVDPHARASEDLEGVARLAILEALRTYKPGRGARFTTYAYYFIHGAMLKALYPTAERLRENGSTTRVQFVSLAEPDQPENDRRPGLEEHLLRNDPDYGRDPGYLRAETADRDTRVRRFVASLPPNQRTITFGVFWEDRTHAEIARERGTSRPAVTRTMQRVHARAKIELDEQGLAIAA